MKAAEIRKQFLDYFRANYPDIQQAVEDVRPAGNQFDLGCVDQRAKPALETGTETRRVRARLGSVAPRPRGALSLGSVVILGHSRLRPTAVGPHDCSARREPMIGVHGGGDVVAGSAPDTAVAPGTDHQAGRGPPSVRDATPACRSGTRPAGPR